MAAAIAVMSNAAKAILLYCGCFLLAEIIADKTERRFFEWVIPPIIIPVAYQATAYFHLPSVPQFGFSAFFLLLSVLYLQYVCRDVSKSGNKMLIQVMLVLSIQWLDVIPALTRWGFGMGELCLSIKNLALLMDKGPLAGSICAIFFFFSTSVALLMARLFASYEKQLKQLNLIRSKEKDLVLLRHQQACARLYQEMQLLVHDLKRPLTVISGLANLLSLPDEKNSAAHGVVILEAAGVMEQMINEIKTPAAVRSVSTGELIDYTMSQVRPLPWGGEVLVDAEAAVRGVMLRINLIRFSRALVNLLDNSHRASELSGDGTCLVKLSASLIGEGVLISVEDNGPGFIKEKNSGSSWGSTGFGLTFVKQVIEAADCSLQYEARPLGGTLCMVRIPACPQESC